MTLIDALFARADLRCTICGAPAGTCDCWERCSCGWHALRGEMCRNPETIRCSTKLKYGVYNRRTRRYEKPPTPGAGA
jgi:hypothetical protein